MGYIAAVPYYLALIVISGFFIYISPGLMDKNTGGMPQYQVFMMGVYLFFALIYPIIFLIIVSRYEIPQGISNQNVYNHFPGKEASEAIYIPFMVVFGIHMICMIPQLMCRFGVKRALEISILILSMIVAILEMKKYGEENQTTLGINEKEIGAPQIIVLSIYVFIWILLYI